MTESWEESPVTGHAEVDAVLGALAQLGELDVAAHVTHFEAAHESLRRSLSSAGQDSPAAARS